MPSIAVLSDLHGNLSALEAVEKKLAALAPDHVLVLGDLVGYFARPDQVAARVMDRGYRAISGNYDLAVVKGGEEGVKTFLKPGIGPVPKEVYEWTAKVVSAKTRAYLASLPKSLTFEEEGRRFLAVHGSPDGIRQYVFPDHAQDALDRWMSETGADIIMMGHTHRPMVRRAGAGLAVNPGSVGAPKDGDPRASFALIDLNGEPKAEIIRVDYDRAEEAGLLAKEGLPKAGGRLLMLDG